MLREACRGCRRHRCLERFHVLAAAPSTGALSGLAAVRQSRSRAWVLRVPALPDPLVEGVFRPLQ